MISVIIINYYSFNFTRKAVESVLQTDGDIEIIIVDNSAITEERTKLEEFSRAEKINVLFNQTNEGFSKACNKAFSISKGESILLLNPDAYIIPPCLKLLEDFLVNTPNAGAVSPQVFWDDEMRYYFSLYTFPSPFYNFLNKLSGLSRYSRGFYSLYKRRKNLNLWKSSIPLKVKNLSGGIVMLKRSAIEQVEGLFDESFFLFFEDADLFFRLRKSGYHLYIIPYVKGVHNSKYGGEKIDIMTQNLSIYYEKHFKNNLLQKITSMMYEHRCKDDYIDYGSWNNPPSFSIPSELRMEYLFEWSPNPLFMPSIGYFGNGKTFILSKQIWNFVDTGVYYSRFTNPVKCFFKYKTLCWKKR